MKKLWFLWILLLAGCFGSQEDRIIMGDKKPPVIASPALTPSEPTTDSVTISWSGASDDETRDTSLEYAVYYSTSDNIGTAEEAAANGTQSGNWQSGMTSQTVTGLTPGTTYYFTVVVRDKNGNTTVYTSTSQATASGDVTLPSVVISSVLTSPTATSPIPVTITFSETVTGFELADITVTNGTAGNLSETTAGKVWTADITPTANASVSVSIAAGKAKDSADNDNTASNTFSIVYDSVLPAVTVTSGSGGTTNQSPIPVTISFNKTVTGFELSDITVVNGTAGNLSETTAGKVWTADITPAANGSVSVSIASGKAKDSADNENTVSNTFSIHYDNTAPSISITTSVSSPTATSPIPVTITFSETVTGFELSDITVVNGTAGNLSEITAGKVWTADITPAANGSVSVSIASGKAKDSADNDNTVSNTLSVIYDNTLLSVVISTTAGNPAKTSPIPVTITFSETVSGFELSDLTLVNATAGNFTPTTADKVWTADLTPSGQGSVSVSIIANSALDKTYEIRGNTVSNTLTIVYDSIAPTQQDTVFTASTVKKGGVSIPILSSGDTNNSVWFAPSGTTVFSEGSTMTKALGTATSINSPANEGSYKLFVIDLAGNISNPSTASLTVDNTAPTNQDTVFTSSTAKKSGVSITIISSGDTNNSVWFAPSGTTVFSEGATMTKAGGTATSINSPANEGSYKLFVIDLAGNISNPSTASLTVDNTAPTNQDTVFASSTAKKSGVSITIISSGDASNSVWFAPSGTTVFSEGSTMTKAGGTATSINSPANEGTYKLFIMDLAGNISNPSTASLTVDNTAPTNQDTVFASSTVKKGGVSIPILSSGDANNSVWFAPSGTTVFSEGSTMTKAGGTATSINSPANEGSYKLFVIDQAGNISNPSTATLTVDNTAPTVGTPLLDLSSSTSTGFTAVWTAASDNLTAGASLQYQLCYADSDFTNDAATAETKTCTGYETNISSKAVSGLSAETYYHFTVVVKDEAGNKSVYTKASYYISSAKSYKVSDTGMTICSDGTATPISCPSSGDWYGQDANYPNIPNAPSWTANGTETVTDNVTGLVWQRCSAGQNSDAGCTGTAGTYTHANAVTYCDGLSLGSRTDWRLPSYEELFTITKQGVYNPAVDTAVFPATVSSIYWSSSPSVSNPTNAWIVNFNGGYAASIDMSNINRVRCVAGGLN